MDSENKVEIFGLGFQKVNLNEAVNLILAATRQHDKSLVVTPNVDQIVQLEKNPDVKAIYRKAKFVFVDGMPLVWFSRLLPKKYHLPERVNGTNLMLNTCKVAAENGFSIAMIGGKEGAAEEAAKKLQQQFPGIIIAGTYCPPFGFENNQTENAKILKLVETWNPTILFVGVGNPKQEKWIDKNWDQLYFKVAMGIGSAIELIAGQVKRAPTWMQQNGLEWLYRLLQEPGRLWKRYLVQDMKFIPIAWREYWKIWKAK